MTYQFQVGDYIQFTRIVQPKKKCGFRTDFNTGRVIATPEIPEQILPQRGEARILKVYGEPKKVDGVKYATAKAEAGKPLGQVRVVLDDAILVAKQDGLFDATELDVADVGPSIYSTDAKSVS